MAISTVPPGGLAGFAQMAPASQNALGKGRSGATTRRRARKARGRPRKVGKPSATAKRKAKSYKLKKGSPAAKARMAKLRKMRKK
jgi:hypothetical protein